MDNVFLRKHHFTTILLLILFSSIPYVNALQNDFVYDDIPFIVENSQFRDPYNILRFIQVPRGIKKVILLTEYQIWGLNPFVYHFTNLILHIFCTVSLYFLLTKIIASHKISLIAGLLFASHPVHTEAVTVITNRNELLAMFFFTWSFSFYTMRKRSLWFYLLSLLSFLFALFSKEGAVVTLPVMLILYDLYFTEEDSWGDCFKKNLQYYVPYGLIIIIFLLYLRFVLLIFPSSSVTEAAVLFLHQSFPVYFYTACKAFLIYIRLLFLPINLNADYVLPFSQSLFEWNVLISLASLLLFLILTVKIYHFSKAISFGMAWFFVTLFPLSNLLLPITPYFVAKRYLYLPSVGFCLIIAVIFEGMVNLERRSYAKMSIFIITIVLGLYSGLTINRNLDWKSEYVLWVKTVKRSPDSFKAHNNLGNVYSEMGLLDEAIMEYNKALRISPNEALIYNNLGIVYGGEGLLDQAEAEFKNALRIRPNYQEALNNMAKINLEKGFLDQAIEVP